MKNQIRISRQVCLAITVTVIVVFVPATEMIRGTAAVFAQDLKPAKWPSLKRGEQWPVSISPWYRYSPDAGYVRYGWKLTLNHIPASNDDFDTFFSMPEIQSQPLQIDGGLAAAMGLNKLRKLANVESIQLDRTNRVTDGGLELLKSLPKLKELSIAGSPITSEGLRHVAVHRGLESLELSIA